MKSKQKTIDFWNLSKEYINHYLPNIRKSSNNTVDAYRTGINQFIDYLEENKHIKRQEVSFDNFSRQNINDFMDWLINVKKVADKTCNLRLTAIHSLMEYASAEDDSIIPQYLDARSVKGLKVSSNTIEYFEKFQMIALLAIPGSCKKSERRNQMMLILMYDTAMRVQETLDLCLSSLHLNAEVPYITIYGKGGKYRNIPIMTKTKQHLVRYLKEFHPIENKNTPLFYTVTYRKKHKLSDDTMEKMIKRYSRLCSEKDISMPLDSHCHMIRKTRAMDLYQSGVPLTHIQQLLGHESISTTSGFYAFATLDTLAKSLSKTEDYVPEKRWADPETLAQLYRL